MRFKAFAIAAAVLVVCSVGAFAAMQIADEARGESAQTTIDATDDLAVEPDIRQTLQPDAGHNPTAYGDTVTVTYDTETWTEGDEYEYYPADGEIEFLVDREGEATIDFTYEIPRDQLADDQLQTVVEANSNVLLVGVGLSIVVVLLFVGGFTARKIMSTTSRSGR